MEPFYFGVYKFIFICGYVLLPSNGQYPNLVCDKLEARHGRQMIVPGPECDLSVKTYCTVKTANYPEEKLMDQILDQRGIMKNIFDNQRRGRSFQEISSNEIFDESYRLPPPLKERRLTKPRTPKGTHPEGVINGRFPASDILANARHGKKIDENGSKNKVIKYGLYLDEFKKSKFREGIEKNKSKISTNDLTSRPNDKVFNDVKIQQATLPRTTPISTTTTTTTTTATTKTTVTTDKPQTTELDLNETTLTTIDLKDETTTLEDFISKEQVTTEHEFFTDKTQTDSPEIKVLPAEKLVSQDNENSSKSSTIALDFGDEIVYETKPISPNSIKNAFRSDLVENTDNNETSGSSTTTTTTESSNFLKGRVEFRPTFSSPSPVNNEQQIVVRPNQQTQQVHRTTPIYDEKQTPSRDQHTKFPFASSNSALPNARPPSQNSPEKFSACNSTSEFIAPTWAKNIYGKNLIVINVGSFIQELHIQECQKDVLYRKMFCRRGCRCEQQYRFQKLLVIDPDDDCRGIFSDWFRFPAGCVCVCYQRPSGMNRNARYMHEMDYDDEDYEDYLEDDFDDPEIRFYYGLDLIDEEEPWQDLDKEEWQDLETSASNQRVYTSFTDIHSIDRSLNIDNPYQDVNKDKGWSNGLNSLVDNNKLTPSIDISNSYSNSTSVDMSRNKKSRLLKGFNRTVNVRPQIPPRRTPPPRASMRSYSFPWVNSPALSIWPSISIYKQFISSNKHNELASRSLSGSNHKYVTASPIGPNQPTVGTLNAATPPYFDWKRRPIMQNITQNRQGKSNILSRIPRNVRNRGT